MGEIINLRKIRKQREREAAAKLAAENRVRHGRSGAAKQADRADKSRHEATLDGAALDGAKVDDKR